MKERALAYRYAKAFFSYAPCDEDVVAFTKKLYALNRFMRQNRARLTCQKKEYFQEFLLIFDLPLKPFGCLLNLLEERGRVKLFIEVVYALWDTYTKAHNIVVCHVISSHALTEEEAHSLADFVSHETGKQVIYRHVVDRSLIAGIRLQGESFIWEQSVADKLRRVEQLFQ